MGEKISLKIEKRSIHGKKVKQLRRQGIIPGVVYGSSMDSMDIQADAGDVRRVVASAGFHTPIQLLGTKKHIAMIKSVEKNPVKHTEIRHIAFHAVRADEPVEAEVPIRLVGVGESPAERAGLVVLQSLEKIEVKALPMDLPEALELSMDTLVKEGDRVKVGDIVLPKTVTFVEHDDGREGTADDDITVKDLVVATVYEPSALAATNEAAAGEATSEEQVAVEGASETPEAEAAATVESK